MFKSKFQYPGLLDYMLLVELAAIFLMILFVASLPTMPEREKSFMYFGMPCLLAAIVFVWRKALKEINKIEITETTIFTRNLITRKRRQIDKANLLGFKKSFGAGCNIILIDTSPKRMVADSCP